MSSASISREDVLARLLTVFRQQGYHGASLSVLSRATGLGKSSLYHHFPAGKDDMVRSVLDHLRLVLERDIFSPLRTDTPPSTRIHGMMAAVDAFYRQGTDACVLAQLVLGTPASSFGPLVSTLFVDWINAITHVLTDAGFPASVAKSRAEDAVVRIEGALVVSAGAGDADIFARTLGRIQRGLLHPSLT